MKERREHIHAVQEAAQADLPPHAILELLVDRLAPTSSLSALIVATEGCFMQAFGISLRTLREIEEWEGFLKTASKTDQDIDALLAPGIAQYLEREAQLPIHDLYGFVDVSLEIAQECVAQALDIPLCEAYNTYRGGRYYCAVQGNKERVIVQSNFDSEYQEWTEEALQDCTVLLYISAATTERADQIRDRLVSDMSSIRHLQRTET